jgi:pSer/pThr/pTyr-binding forkhead associated (FHA) protein
MPLSLIRLAKLPVLVGSPDRIPLPIDGKVLIVGRHDDADVKLKSFENNGTMVISRRHGKLWYDPFTKCGFVLDLGSVNGIFVNGKKLLKDVATKLHEHDTISFGSDTANRNREFCYSVVREEEVKKPANNNNATQHIQKGQKKGAVSIPTPSISSIPVEAENAELTEVKNENILLKKKIEMLQEQLTKEKSGHAAIVQKVTILEGNVVGEKERALQMEQSLQKLKEKLKECLECPVCLCIKTNGNVLLRCGHAVCGPCLKDWKKKKNCCPACNVALEKEAPARAYVLDKLAQVMEDSHSPGKKAIVASKPNPIPMTRVNTNASNIPNNEPRKRTKIELVQPAEVIDVTD